MKIAIIGTTSLFPKMVEHKKRMEAEGHEVRLPCFDLNDLNENLIGEELEICLENKRNIKWADEVHIFWDQRSMGTIFDLGMCIALEKPLRAIYIEKKTFKNVIYQWEWLTHYK